MTPMMRIRMVWRRRRADRAQAGRLRLLGSKLRSSRPDGKPEPGQMDVWARWIIGMILLAITVTALAKSFRNLMWWAGGHADGGGWAWTYPMVLDQFIVAGELILFVATIRLWGWRDKVLGWLLVVGGLAVSTASNFGYLGVGASVTDRGTNAVYPVALFLALAASLEVLRLVRKSRITLEPDRSATPDAGRSTEPGRSGTKPAGRPAKTPPGRRTATAAAPGAPDPAPRHLPPPARRGPADPVVLARYAESVDVGDPLSQRQLAAATGRSERQARNAITAYHAEPVRSNGHDPAGVAS